MITIKVPATSANLGPGFDSIGVALQLYATFKVKEGAEFSIRGCPVAFTNEHNLFHRAYFHRVAQLKLTPKILDIEVQSDIPVARGLGSSASFIVAGILCAHLIHEIDFTLEEIAWASSAFEGHPDNACPACLGGFRSSLLCKDKVLSEPFRIHPDLRFYFIIPDFELLTSLTRLALPDKVLMSDAVHNIARLPLLLKAMEMGDQDRINTCIQDKLHHPYRFPLIYQSEHVLAILDKAGIKSSYISGAGPAIGILHMGPLDVEPIQLELNTLRHKFQLIELKVEPNGIRYSKD
jgi:homoserine kinase